MDDICTLYYDVKNNYMIDDSGSIVYNIYKYITPKQLFLFKKNQEDTIILSGSNIPTELIYPNKNEVSWVNWRLEHHRDTAKYRTQK